MYVVRDIFHLKFDHYKDAKALLDEAAKKGVLPIPKSSRALSDFTGDSYRLRLEEGYDTLADYEKSLTGSMSQGEWQQWYGKFKEHVECSEREILKEIM